MRLTAHQQEMLDGKHGETMAKVMKTLVMYGETFGADSMVAVTSEYNHLVTSFGLKVMSPVYDLMQRLVDAGVTSGQKFSMDPRPVDKNVPANFLQNFVFNKFMYTKQDTYEVQLEKLGLMNKDAFTCTCYMDEVGNKPKMGDNEILSQSKEPLDYIFVPIGGGGLASGLGSYISQMSPSTKIIGVEPGGAACMKAAIENGAPVKLENIDKFVDGAAVQLAGKHTFEVCRQVLDDIVVVPEGAVCTTIIHMYNKSAIVVEPAGALAVAALKFYKDKIKGKRVACVVSGSNNDITRMEEIREKSLLYEGLKHYFIVNFPQKSGAVLSFIRDVIGPTDDLVHIQYIRKTNKNFGPALIGIELAAKEDFEPFMNRLKAHGISYEYINENNQLFEILI